MTTQPSGRAPPGLSNRLGIGETSNGSDHPNPANSQPHPAITPSTDLFPSQSPWHSARKPTPETHRSPTATQQPPLNHHHPH